MSVDSLSLLDTNIMIYLLDASEPAKCQRAEQLVQAGLSENKCIISMQVVQETLNVATRKLNFSQEDTERFLNDTLLPLCRIVSPTQLYPQALAVQFRYHYSFYDALIIAAALQMGCGTLYSEDLQHNQIIGHLTIKNPFVG